MPPRFRLRTRRLMVLPVLVLAVLAATAAVTKLTRPPSWLTWLPPWLAPVAAAVLGVLGVWWAQPWAKRRQAAADKDRQAIERLKQHLSGRVNALPLLGEPEADALALGVHEAIPLSQPRMGMSATAAPVTGVAWKRLPRPRRRRRADPPENDLDPDLPTFVDRDIGPKVRSWLQEAQRSGGFLLLIGDSSVGKTRLLYEAARKVLPDFAVLAPDRGDWSIGSPKRPFRCPAD